MLRKIKNLIGFITIGLIWLLPVSLPEIQAQQTAAPPSTAAPSSALTIENLKSRRLAIENKTDIDAAVKSDSLKYVDQAIAYLEDFAITNTKARELSKLIQTAPERLKILQAELKRPFTAPERVEERARQMKTIKLEQRLTQKEAELATAQTRLQEWRDRLTAEKAIFNQTPEQLTNATSRLKEIQTELDAIAEAAETDILIHSRMLSIRSEWENLKAEIKLNEQRPKFPYFNSIQSPSNPQALADRVIDSVGFLSDVERKSLDSKIQELFARRLDMIKKLKSGYDRLFKMIQDTEFAEQKLVSTSEDFGEFLDRHLLWIRSSKPVRIVDIQKLKAALGWFFDPAYWNQLFKDTGQSIHRQPFVWVIGLLIGLYLIVSRRWTRRKLKDIAEAVGQQVEDSFLLTMKALGLTILLAAVWPFLLAFPAIQLTRLPQPYAISTDIAGGLIFATLDLIVLVFFYNVCRLHGLAQAHFQWPESVRRTLMSNLGWLIPIEVATSFFLGAMETSLEIEFSGVLAKLALVIQALATSAFAARTLRFRGGIASVLVEKHPQSWLCRLRYVWYPLAILLPLYILWLTLIGYYYSAIEIHNLVINTVALVFALIIFNGLALRMLMLARRRIALKKAIAKQELYLESKSRTESGEDAGGSTRSSPMETIVEMSEIDEQTRTLLKLALFILVLAGIWVIWEPVFPAFGILQDIQFWSYSTVVDGVTKTVPITLANIAMAVTVAVTTIIAGRNLPGLLEVILLNRLPLDPGARYAYSTVCRYAITAIGIIIVFNTIGIKWAKLQWLIAALSVGLGFGLQEIVANFVCGLIVLFERPFRIGDTVTIGDVSGTVTRIRIRATTVVDWDRKELIVPNKEFIVGRLINWSLSDNIVRRKVPVGIAYGSDTDLAEDLLIKVANSNPLVSKSPEPKAVFLGFGDNALNFELRVYIKNVDDWIPMLHSLNRAIDKAFRQAGVTIAFPQRDMHLDATGPLEVRVVSEPSDSEAGKCSS